MYLSKIEIKNYKVFKDTTVFEFHPTEHQNISLICGQNGFGKTTFLTSIIWALYGKYMEEVDEAYSFDTKGSNKYSKYLNKCLNNQAKTEGEKKFSVTLTFKEVRINSNRLPAEIVITRKSEIDQPDDSVRVTIDGKASELTQEPQEFIEKYILPRQIARFFLFDAEKVVHLAKVIDSKGGREEMDEAYSVILGTDKYHQLHEALAKYNSILISEVATTEQRKQLLDYESEVGKKSIDLENAKNEKEKNEHEITKIENEIESIESIEIKTIREEGVSEQQAEKLAKDIEDKKESINEIENYLYGDHAELMPFLFLGSHFEEILETIEREKRFDENKTKLQNQQDELYTIIDEIENAKVPEELRIDSRTKNFYIDLFKKIIKTKLLTPDESFDDELAPYLNLSKPDSELVQSVYKKIAFGFGKEYLLRLDQLKKETQDLEALNTQWKAYDFQASSEDTSSLKEEKNRLKKKISDLKKRNIDLERIISELDTSKRDSQNKVYKLRSLLEKSAELDKKIKLLDTTTLNLKNVIIKIKQEKKKLLQNSTLEWIKKIFHKDNFINKVDIEFERDKIGLRVRLYASMLTEIELSSLSMGERQLFVTALLKALITESGVQFPVFIDSPLQKLDQVHAANLVKYFYPEAARQVILLPLPHNELRQEEFELLKPHIDKCYVLNHENNGSYAFSCEPASLLSYYQDKTQ
jgi:DNA sulfur modification protein DndD